MKNDEQIVYERHPVTPQRKAQLRSQGYTIIDAIYAPRGYVHPDAKDGSADGSEGDKSLTVAQIKEALAAKGIEIPEGAKKAELQALLDGSAEGSQGD